MIGTRRPDRTLRRLLVLLPALVLLGAPSGHGQTAATVSTLKAAFIYNFAKFTEWPDDVLQPKQRIALCVLGDHAVADALEQTIKGRAADGHELTVETVRADGALRSCHLLYVTGLPLRQVTQVIDSLKSAPVFTVGDAQAFCESGGVGQLILENERMRFAVNVAAADRARLRLSSKLLSLATLVKDKRAHAEP